MSTNLEPQRLRWHQHQVVMDLSGYYTPWIPGPYSVCFILYKVSISTNLMEDYKDMYPSEERYSDNKNMYI